VKQFKKVVKSAVLAGKKTYKQAVNKTKAVYNQTKQAVKEVKQTTKELAIKTNSAAKAVVKDIKKPVVKSLNSFKEIGKDFKSGLDKRADKALDSPYDFANYLTLGAVDGIWSGAKGRADKMLDSPSDFFNYATFGFTGMVQGAVNPKDPLSKEHWLDSFGVATSVLGVKGASSTKPTGVTRGKSTSSSSSNSDKSMGEVGTGGSVAKEYGDVVEETVTYSRVQGGQSKDILKVNEDGTLSLNEKFKSNDLNVSTGKDHAEYFKNKRGDGSYKVEFEVPKWLDEFIQENAISQDFYKSNPLNQGGTAPKIVDKGIFEKYNFDGSAYELPSPTSEWLIEYAKNAKIVP